MATGKKHKDKNILICELCGDKAVARYCKDCEKYWPFRNILIEFQEYLKRKTQREEDRFLHFTGKIDCTYYVYFWYKEGDAMFPFYIGHGTGRRAEAVHYADKEELAFCEKVRRNAKKFKVVYVATQLTKEEARLIETTFIRYFRSIGLILTNQVD